MMMTDETSFRYAQAEIRTQLVVICDPMHYELDHGGTRTYIGKKTRSKCLKLNTISISFSR